MNIYYVRKAQLDSQQISTEYGISCHRGIIVFFDEDFDTRVIDVIDELPSYIIDKIFAISEHEGGLVVYVKEEALDELEDGIECWDGDWWNVEQRVANKKDNINFYI